MTEAEISDILARNEEHNRRLFAPYNPYTGEGSPVERRRLDLIPGEHILIPIHLADSAFFREVYRYPCARDYAEAKGIPWEDFVDSLTRTRIKWDFEFWAATCCNIKDKLSGTIITFILRHAQLKLLKVLIAKFIAGEPIRVILLKARQWGGSTLVQMFMAWIQIFHKTNWNSVIVAHQKDPARNIRAMYTRMSERHPAQIQSVRLTSFEGSSNNKQLKDNGSVISVGTMLNPESLRSDDIKMAHLSEVGLYEHTQKRNPEDLIAAIVSAIPTEPDTVIALESTAKGVGNYFHNTWCAAEAGENAYTPVFVAWWEIDIYYTPFADEAQKRAFAATLTEDEIYRFNIGATLEGINWYRIKRGEYNNDWSMRREYPSTPQEAFDTSGNYAHHPLYIEQMRPFTREPLYRGELFADEQYGPRAIDSSLTFAETTNGNLWLWALPDKTRNIRDRYVVSMDIGGRTEKADWTVLSVIDRQYLMTGGLEECIGTYRFHLDQDLAVWKAVQLAMFFNEALLAVEFNSLKNKNVGGDHSITILDEIKPYYSNLFSRSDPKKIEEGEPSKLGFHTNVATKTDLVNQMNKRFRDIRHIERDKRALDEAAWLEEKPDGSYGAISGKNDDIYMSRGVGLKVSDMMEEPAVIEPRSTLPSSRSPGFVATESTF